MSNQIDVERRGHVGVDVAQEGEGFLVAVTALALCQHPASGHVQGGEQARGAVAHGIVRHPLDVAQPHGQQWRGALQRLDLTILIHAPHDGMIGRVEV